MINADIGALERIASTDCGSERDNDHDYDHCPACYARYVLNEIGTSASYGLKKVESLSLARTAQA